MPRIFIAVPIAETVRNAIATAVRWKIADLPPSLLSNVRWVKQQQYHITMKFLGDIAEHRVQSVADAVATAVATIDSAVDSQTDASAEALADPSAEALTDASTEAVADSSDETLAESPARPTYHLQARGAGAFPHPDRARVLWIGVHGDVAHLTRLQQQIESNLVVQGFSRSHQPFKPHITIGRLRDPGPVANALRALNDYDFGTWDVDCIQVIESHLSSGGARYTVRYDLPVHADFNHSHP